MEQLTIDKLIFRLGQKDVTVMLLELKVSALMAENQALKAQHAQAQAPGA